MSGQPRRKQPRRAPLAEEAHTQRPIEQLRDFTDADFAPDVSFVKAAAAKPTAYLIMEDVSDRSVSGGGGGRRRPGGKNAKESGMGQFGLQTANNEGKKGSVKNWRPLAKSVDTNNATQGESYAELWAYLKEATDLVFQGRDVTKPFEVLYNKVELICVSKNEATVFKDLQASFNGHIKQVNRHWERLNMTFCGFIMWIHVWVLDWLIGLNIDQ